MLAEATREIDLLATWGDYRVEPPLPEILVLPEVAATGERQPDRPQGIHWVRSPGKSSRKLDVTRNASGIPLSDSAAPQVPGGGLELMLHQRLVEQVTPEGPSRAVLR